MTKRGTLGFEELLPPGELTAHRLDGGYDSSQAPSLAGELRGGRILQTRALDRVEDSAVRAVLSCPSSFGDQAMRCFLPGLGLTGGAGTDAVEVLICLRCFWVYLFRGDALHTAMLSQSGCARLSELYVALFPGARPEDA